MNFSNLMLSISNFISANGPGPAKPDSSGSFLSDLIAGILKIAASIVTILWSVIINALYTVCSLCLRLVDLLQYFVQKLVGIDIWMGDRSALQKITDLGDMDIIIRFLMQPVVRRVLISISVLGGILIVVFSILAIIRANYKAASDSGEADNKPGNVIKKALNAIFLMIMVPTLVIFGIIGSNVVLASICNAISGGNNLSIGGTIFSASAYNANRYREYANNGMRVPMIYENGTEVVRIKEYDTTNDMMILMYKIATREVKIPAIEELDWYKNKANDGFSWLDGISVSDVKGAGDNPASLGTDFENDFDGFIKAIKTFVKDSKETLKIKGNEQSDYFDVISHFGSDEKYGGKLVKSIYDENNLASKDYKDFYLSFDASYEVDSMYTFESTGDSVKIFRNTEAYSFYEDFATIPQEYYVMADVIDFAVEKNIELCIVNANNSAINWEGVSTYNRSYKVYENEAFQSSGSDSRYVMSSTQPDNFKQIATGAFYVKYYDGTNRLYWSNTDSESELDGSTYIICTRTNTGYKPLIQGGEEGFMSSFLNKNYMGPVVARGLLESTGIIPSDYNKPTYICEMRADDNGVELEKVKLNSTDSTYKFTENDYVNFAVKEEGKGDPDPIYRINSQRIAGYINITGTGNVGLVDQFGRLYKTDSVNVSSITSIDNDGAAYIKISNSEQKIKGSSDYIYISKFGSTSNYYQNVPTGDDGVYNKTPQLYAKVKYKVLKVTTSDGGVYYLFADLNIEGVYKDEDRSTPVSTVTTYEKSGAYITRMPFTMNISMILMYVMAKYIYTVQIQYYMILAI